MDASKLLVELNHVVEEGILKCFVKLVSRKSSEPFGLKAINELSVIVAVTVPTLAFIVPLVMPQEGIRPCLFAFGRPVVLHVIVKLSILLDNCKIKTSISFFRFAVGPQTMDGKGLTA
jgi:hypothetical protein